MRVIVTVLLLCLAAMGPALAAHTQSSNGRTASFDHKTGNEWWVEVVVTGSPSSVSARDDGGGWVLLEKKSWGAWAKSFHIEPGNRVQFRAAWSDGAVVESCWFTHPAGVEECAATPPPPPPPMNGTFAFTHGGGNEWWVEAKVSPRPAAVEAMDTGGAWVPLAFKSWGEWAASFHVEAGNQVKFRARTDGGAWVESCWFTHPAGVAQCGTPPPPTATWPTEGSFVKYVARAGERVPGYDEEYEVNVTYTYTNGAWQRACEGWRRQTIGDPEEPDHYEEERILVTEPAAPPKVTKNATTPGGWAVVPGVGCIWGDAEGTVFGPVRSTVTRAGSGVDVVSYKVEHEPIWPALDGGAWDATLGLVLGYGSSGSYSGSGGRLVDTDAPLTTAPPARASWPFEGSFARYRGTQDGGGSFDALYQFSSGAWTLECTVRNADGSIREVRVSDNAPFHGPTAGFAVGDDVYLPLPEWWCDVATWDNVYVERQQSESTRRNGAAYTARVWYADEDDDAAGGGADPDRDYDVWWDTRTGLYVEWDHNEYQGWLTDTDAPLARG